MPAPRQSFDEQAFRSRHANTIDGLARETEKARAEIERPDWTDASKDGDEWQEPVDAFCTLIGKDAATMTKPTRYKLMGIFKDVGACTRTTAPEVAAAIAQFKERYEWWDDDWPGDGFCQRLGMLLTPDTKEPSIFDTRGYRTEAPAAL
jgi:hypothetical protein